MCAGLLSLVFANCVTLVSPRLFVAGVDPLLSSSTRRLLHVLSAADRFSKAMAVRRAYVGGVAETVHASSRSRLLAEHIIGSPLTLPARPPPTTAVTQSQGVTNQKPRSLMNGDVDVDSYLDGVGVASQAMDDGAAVVEAPPPLFTLGAALNPKYNHVLGSSDGYCVLDARAFDGLQRGRGAHASTLFSIDTEDADMQEEIAVFERVIVDALDQQCKSLDDHVSVLLTYAILVLPLPSKMLLQIADHHAGIRRHETSTDFWRILIPFEGFSRVLAVQSPTDKKFECVLRNADVAYDCACELTTAVWCWGDVRRAITQDRIRIASMLASFWIPSLVSDRFTTVARVLRGTKSALESAVRTPASRDG